MTPAKGRGEPTRKKIRTNSCQCRILLRSSTESMMGQPTAQQMAHARQAQTHRLMLSPRPLITSLTPGSRIPSSSPSTLEGLDEDSDGEDDFGMIDVVGDKEWAMNDISRYSIVKNESKGAAMKSNDVPRERFLLERIEILYPYDSSKTVLAYFVRS